MILEKTNINLNRNSNLVQVDPNYIFPINISGNSTTVTNGVYTTDNLEKLLDINFINQNENDILKWDNVNKKWTNNILKGPKGDTGQQGQQGDTGQQGDIGDLGDNGVFGSKGDIGPQGQQGDIGPQGQKGDTSGQKGDTGDIGPQGQQGDTGPQGQQGDIGDTGQKGEESDIIYNTDLYKDQFSNTDTTLQSTKKNYFMCGFGSTLGSTNLKNLSDNTSISNTNFFDTSKQNSPSDIWIKSDNLSAISNILNPDFYGGSLSHSISGDTNFTTVVFESEYGGKKVKLDKIGISADDDFSARIPDNFLIYYTTSPVSSTLSYNDIITNWTFLQVCYIKVRNVIGNTLTQSSNTTTYTDYLDLGIFQIIDLEYNKLGGRYPSQGISAIAFVNMGKTNIINGFIDAAWFIRSISLISRDVYTTYNHPSIIIKDFTLLKDKLYFCLSGFIIDDNLGDKYFINDTSINSTFNISDTTIKQILLDSSLNYTSSGGVYAEYFTNDSATNTNLSGSLFDRSDFVHHHGNVSLHMEKDSGEIKVNIKIKLNNKNNNDTILLNHHPIGHRINRLRYYVHVFMDIDNLNISTFKKLGLY